MIPKTIEKYRTENGIEPFSEWLETVPIDVQARIFAYVRRLSQGGAHKNIEVIRGGEGVKELRIHFGPGFRVYFGESRGQIILLLIGGSKRTQDSDIAKAKKYWRDYNEKT